MNTPKFQRKIEDFVCERCGTRVAGNGYTNHCPKCLWSKHVDVNPGDRSAVCKGLMEPVGIEGRGGEFSIIYHCRMCGKTIKNKVAPEDDPEIIASVSTKPVK